MTLARKDSTKVGVMVGVGVSVGVEVAVAVSIAVCVGSGVAVEVSVTNALEGVCEAAGVASAQADKNRAIVSMIRTDSQEKGERLVSSRIDPFIFAMGFLVGLRR